MIIAMKTVTVLSYQAVFIFTSSATQYHFSLSVMQNRYQNLIISSYSSYRLLKDWVRHK